MCGILCFIHYGKEDLSVEFDQCLEKLKPRGPDKSNIIIFKKDNITIYLGFTRLAIMDISDAGLQPFVSETGTTVICNGEIYNYRSLVKTYGIKMESDCDCEIILPLYEKFGFHIMLSELLDAEFATVLFDEKRMKIYAGRDRFGVRPLFYGFNNDRKIYAFASEMKALHNIMTDVYQQKSNHYEILDLSEKDFDNMMSKINYVKYYSFGSISRNLILLSEREYIQRRINDLLTRAVRKRLCADRKIGFLLSGGLDSSLVVAIATRILGPENIVCFTVGFEGSSDVEASKLVVKYLGIKQHHIVPFNVEMGLAAIPDVICAIESYDITTIRASTGQYIMAKYIRENTDIRVLLSGEGSDEIHSSYKYFRFAPNKYCLREEAVRLLKELQYFDNLRTDRTMASQGLEVRVPFLDFDYVDFIMKLDPGLFVYSAKNIEKRIVRDSFCGYLPDEILYRSKEAFSDAVSSKDVNWYRSVVDKAEKEISDDDLKYNPFKINLPETKEALYYRRIFSKYYPDRDDVVPHYWLPKWVGDVKDPSATILPSL